MAVIRKAKSFLKKQLNNMEAQYFPWATEDILVAITK
jgi:hypothetical protein